MPRQPNERAEISTRLTRSDQSHRRSAR
jgi:hypothetical protein